MFIWKVSFAVFALIFFLILLWLLNMSTYIYIHNFIWFTNTFL